MGGPLPFAGGPIVVGQQIGKLVAPLGVEGFDDVADRSVERQALAARQGGVGRLMRKGMAEEVFEFGRILEQPDESGDLQPL
jgi:hypothetical protein